MACLHANSTVAPSDDPTATLGLRRAFERAARKRFRWLRGRIRHLLRGDGLQLNEDEHLPIDFETDKGRRRAFDEWLRGKLDEGVLEPASFSELRNGQHWTASYIRTSYGRGWQHATRRLRQEGMDVESSDVEMIFNLPVAKSQLRNLYIRTYNYWEDLTDDVRQALREELTRGVAEGVNPAEMARRLTDRTETLERTRATTIARTEVINSYSEATLDRYEQAGVNTVSHGEWLTAGDRRVCALCRSLAGETFKITEMRNGTVDFQGSTYRLKPPAHPSGRCAIAPVVNS